MPDDAELLRQYTEEGSEEAFRELVDRNLRLVYGAALRRVDGDRQLALDIAQQVFVAVARDAARLSRHAAITAWLYAATRNAAIKILVAERRRRKREGIAATMREFDENAGRSVAWDDLRPVLDEVMDELGTAEREAVLLRYFDERTFAEVASALRTTEEAARKRVDRALEKLRVLFARRGITCSAAALAEALVAQPALAGHAALASAISGSALAGLSGGAGLSAAATMTLMSPAKAVLATIGVAVVFGALNIGAARKREALTDDLRSITGQQDSVLNAARTQNRSLHDMLDAARTKKPVVADDSARMAQMADLIRSGLLGVTTWPLSAPAVGQDNLLMAAESVSGVIGLNPGQLTALRNALYAGRAQFRSAVAAGSEVVRTENQVTIVVGGQGMAATRAAYDGMLTEIQRAIGPEKISLLEQCGFLSAVETAFGTLGTKATTATVTKTDLVINGRTIAGQFSYNGRFSGEDENLLHPPSPNSTFGINGGTNGRSALRNFFGDDLMARIPGDF